MSAESPVMGVLEFKNGMPVIHHGEQQEKNVSAEFFNKEVLNPLKSNAEGKPVHDTKVYVRIEVHGSQDVHIAPVQDSHKLRFPTAWAAFISGDEDQQGTPLEQLPGIDGDTVARYRGLYHVGTIEALANLTDAGIMKLGPGARQYQRVAQSVVKNRGDLAANGESKRITSLEELVKKQSAQIDALLAGNKKKGKK
jgi:hypothetical protein